MVRGTRSSQAVVESNGVAPITRGEDVANVSAVDMQVDEEGTPDKGRKRKSPEPVDHQTSSDSRPPIDLSPAKRTRSQLRNSNPLSPTAPNRLGSTSTGLLNGNDVESSLTTLQTNGTPSSLSPNKNPDDVVVRENGRRSSGHSVVRAASPVAVPGRATRGSNRVKARAQPAAELEQDPVEKVFTMDGFDEDDQETGGIDGVITRSKRRQILGVLIAMETNSSTGDYQSRTSRTRLVKIVDVPFVPVEQNGDATIKDEMNDGDVNKTTKESTLRRVLLSKDETVTVETLLHHLSALSARLLPSLPNPFADLVKRPQTQILPPSDAPTLTVRALGSKSKQDKDMPVYDHLVAVKEAVLSLVFQGTSPHSRAPPTPMPKTRWALHQRTTVPWPMQPRRGDKAAPVIATDRVHLDWFTSVVATGNGKLEDVEDDLVKSQGLAGQEDEGTLTRLQAEGYLGLAQIATVAPPDREAEEISRSTGPTLGQLLYTNASAKLRRYRAKRREAIPVGCPVTFLSHTNSFTPSFAPTYDSTMASGGWSFYSTMDAARAASTSRQWIESGWNANYRETTTGVNAGPSVDEDTPRDRALRAARLLQDETPIDPALIDALEAQQSDTLEARTRLDENAQSLQKLSRKQDERLRRGEMQVLDPEEHAIALVVSSNLLHLASGLPPRALLPRHARRTANAANLAQTLVTTPGPVYRGTLDPARPKAIAENYTVHTRDEPVPPKRRDNAPVAAATPARPTGHHVNMNTPTPLARTFSGHGLPPSQGFQ